MRRRAMDALFRHVMKDRGLGIDAELAEYFPEIPSLASVQIACFGEDGLGNSSRFAEYADRLEPALARVSEIYADSLLVINMRMLIGLAKQAVAYLRNEQIPDFRNGYDLPVLTIFADACVVNISCPQCFPVEMDLVKAGLLVLDIHEKSEYEEVKLVVRGTGAYATTNIAEVFIGSAMI